MPLSVLFWMVYIISVLFGGWVYYDGQPNWPRRFSGYFVLWLLVGILGYRVFGTVIK